jgi:penicillin amidase
MIVSNPLGASGIDLIENIVNRGPFPTSGGGEIINATGWNAARGFEVRTGPSERVIYDLGDFGNSVAVHTTGQSGHPYSPHYSDMVDMWRNIEYQPLLWTREQVEAAAVNHLVLTPDS